MHEGRHGREAVLMGEGPVEGLVVAGPLLHELQRDALVAILRATQGPMSPGVVRHGGMAQRAHLAHELPCLLPRRAGGEEGAFEGIGARRALRRWRLGKAFHEGLATARRHCCVPLSGFAGK